MTEAARLVVLLDTALPKSVPPAYCGRNAHVPQVSKPAQPRWRTAMNLHSLPRADEPLHSTISRRSRRVSLIVRHGSAWVCKQCGEAYFEEREVNAIQSAADSLDRRIRQLLVYA